MLALAALGCEPPETFVPLELLGGPSGVIEGTVTYSARPPCTEGGRVVGAAILLAFDGRLLPPPEGLGTSAASLAVVTGEQLFAGARDRLTYDPDGKLACPPDSAPPVTVSAPWAIAPLPAGVYQVRGFYDVSGDFDPGFSIANLATKGDVGGGAIDNAADVLLGAAPDYREIAVGVPGGDGSLVIPPEGARVPGVAVTLGLPMPTERPLFYAKAVLDEVSGNADPNRVVMPSDYEIPAFSDDPAETEASFIRVVLAAGVPPEEVDAAAAPPFGLPVKGEPSFRVTWQDVNGDGELELEGDHVPESELVPTLFPLTIFAKLEDGAPLVGQAQPAVVLQGLTLEESLLQTALSPPDLDLEVPEIIAALRPTVLCIDPLSPGEPAVLVVSRKEAADGNPLIPDEDAVKAALAAQFGRKVDIAYGCLPQGLYSMNTVYGTGQAWSIPNEAGVCDPVEEPSGDGSKCGTRARLPTQSVVVTIGPPSDPGYCEGHPTPAACLPPK